MAINQYYSADDISTYEISDDSNISSVIKYNNNERVNPNNIKTYYLDESVDKKENYKIKLK